MLGRSRYDPACLQAHNAIGVAHGAQPVCGDHQVSLRSAVIQLQGGVGSPLVFRCRPPRVASSRNF